MYQIHLLLFLLSSFTIIFVHGYVTRQYPAQSSTQGNQSRLKFRIKNDERRRELLSVSAQAASANIASITALAKLISTCGIGIGAAKSGLLDKSALSVLSKLIFGLFQPCLLFVNVASTVASSGGSNAIKILPFAAAFQIGLGYTIGKIVSLLVYGTKTSEESKQLLTCTTFGNSGPLPLVFADALLRTHSDISYHSKSVGYISLYLLGWSPLFWIVAPGILNSGDFKVSKENSGPSSELAKRIFSPPIIGAICGLIVGAFHPLRNLFIGSKAIFNPFFESARTIGAGYLPAVLLVLAGSLIPSSPSASVEPSSSQESKKSENIAFVKQIATIYTSRFLLTPLIGFSIIRFLKKLDHPILSFLLKDPILIFVLLLESCMPSAQNSTVILQLAGRPGSAAKMARVLLSIYVLGVPAMSFWIASILKETALL